MVNDKKLIMPKGDGRLELAISSLKIYYEANGWVTNNEFKEIFKALDNNDYDNNTNEAMLLHKARTARYFGFIQYLFRSQNGLPGKQAKITQSGKRFYEAYLADNKAAMIDTVMDAIVNYTFGRNNYATDDSDSDVEPPKVLIKFVFNLGFLTKEEFIYSMYNLHDAERQYSDVLNDIKKSRQERRSLKLPSELSNVERSHFENVYGDWKFIQFIREVGIIQNITDKAMLVEDVKQKYSKIIENLSVYNDKVENKEIEDVPIITSIPEHSFTINEFIKDLKLSGVIYSNYLVKRFIAACLAKPFVLLNGLSGSGKTKLALTFAKWISANPNQYCLVPVGADWTNREPLLGYPNALNSKEYIKPDNGVIDLIIRASKDENKNLPFFLILDEMNLSHVERYFADFLSAMESEQHIHIHSAETDLFDREENLIPSKLHLPKNLFIIGTVNIDETTYMFSPKVLDRASVIEFRVDENDLSRYFNESVDVKIDKIAGRGSLMGSDFCMKAFLRIEDTDESSEIKEELKHFFRELQKVGAEFGYRTASEILKYAHKVSLLEDVETAVKWTEHEIIDTAVVQKLLPKLHGSRKKLAPVLQKLAELCVENPNDIDLNVIDFENEEKNRAKIGKVLEVKYPISFKKLSRMYDRAVQDGFTSFAEA